MKGIVGVVGLGIMGGAMARNLAAAGWRVLGFDVDPARAVELAADGVEAMPDLASLAAAAPVIMTSLPSPGAAAATAQGIAAAGLTEGRIVIEASTLALEDKLAFQQVLTAAGHVALDCPMSGTGAQARTRDLVVCASGDPDAIAAVRPIFADFARSTQEVGAYGNGSRMKFVANLLVAIHNVASAEAMLLGMRAGLEPQQIVEVIRAGAGNSRVFELRAPMMAEEVYEPPTMRCSTWQKDMEVIGDFAASVGAPAPLFAATALIYTAAIEAGLGGQDTAAVFAVLRGMARPTLPGG